jgi:glutamyl-tRNA synthetase
VTVRCRFAPAPSGSIHVGNARSALFSWLTARHHGGAFVLRIEDTDATRVTEEAVKGVLEDLDWLGLGWDEGPDVGGPLGPYRQSERLDLYREMTRRLQDAGHAYRCWCTPDELEERRKAALARGEPPGYDGRCWTRPAEEVAAFEAERRPFAIRFHMPERDWAIDDLVKGEIRWSSQDLRDFVIVRSDGSPVFLLAVAVDDMLMEITHVVRGDDLLSSAPRNAAVIGALGGTPPAYAHLPQVLGPDGKPLSKRHGATSVAAFREQGFLPEAMVNYLALLGWAKDDHTTFLTRDELIESFELSHVSHNPAAFDTQKLEAMDNHYLQSLDEDDLAARCVPFLTEAGLSVDPDLLGRAIPIVRERMKTLTEAPRLLRFLFIDDIEPNDQARKLIESAPDGYLKEAAEALDSLERWDGDTIQRALDELASRHGLSRTKGWQPIRAAVTGSNVSPPLPESLELLGQERTVARLRAGAR